MIVRIFFLLVLFVFTNQQAQAQTTGKQTAAMLSQSPAGGKIVRFIKAVNATDANEAFIKRNFEPKLVEKQTVSKLLGIINEAIPSEDGKLTVYSADRMETFKYELIAKGSKGGWVKLGFTFEENEPYRIAGFTLDGIDAPSGKLEAMEL